MKAGDEADSHLDALLVDLVCILVVALLLGDHGPGSVKKRVLLAHLVLEQEWLDNVNTA